jgi:4-amino-4-deoxy-L-arabinose transferase-like glycosyltransferase
VGSPFQYSNKLASTANASVTNQENFPLIAFLRRDHDESTATGRLSLWALLVLVTAYVLPGMAGFGPWKPDEPYMFGLIHSLMESGDWVVPSLAGEPFMEKPPLMVWMAAATATLSLPWLQPEHGARLAIGIFMLIAMASLAAAARRWWGAGSGRHAVLALLGSVGLMQHSHMLIADIPLLAGVAVAFHGWAWIAERPFKGGMLLGTGIGMSLMAKGLIGPGMLGVTALLLPVAFRSWRTSTYRNGLMVALIASLPWLLIWPTALFLRSPALFAEWLWVNNIGRFLGSSVPMLGASHEPAHLLKTIPWFTFPVLPLALWSFWRMGQRALNHPPLQLSGLAFLVMLVTLAVSASGRVVYLLPMLIPLAISATPMLSEFPAGLERNADWCARLLFGGATLVCWFIWITLVLTGAPPPWPILAAHLPMNYPFASSRIGICAAIVLSIGWLGLMVRLPQLKARALIGWASGAILLWGTAFALLLPWIDAAKSYQATFREMTAALPDELDCLATHGLGESERGMLHYISGIEPERLEVHPDAVCDVLLWQGLSSDAPQGPDFNGLRLHWQGTRPGERRERFWIFTRTPRPVVATITSSLAAD